MKDLNKNVPLILWQVSLQQRAIDTYGIDKQLDMLQEELAELIVAVNHMKRGRCGWDKVLEEMGDVEILIDQFKLQDGHLKIINDSKMSKLKRLEERLDAHNKKE